jgi:catechol 2,3-dioxygenase-like lactoylglutathione lyase family enzyme
MNTLTFPRMHVSLYVSNLASTVNFYNQFFGKPADKIRTKYAKYVLDSPSLIISFVENPERVQQNFGHLGFQVESPQELEHKKSQAQQAGLIDREEIGTACCYAVQDKFWAKDPDGVQWEVYYFHEDAEFNDPHYEMADASACCMPTDTTTAEKPKIQLKTLQTAGVSCAPDSGCC